MNNSLPEENDESQYPDKLFSEDYDAGNNSVNVCNGATAQSVPSHHNMANRQQKYPSSKDTGYTSQVNDLMGLENLEPPDSLMSERNMEDFGPFNPRNCMTDRVSRQQWVHPPGQPQNVCRPCHLPNMREFRANDSMHHPGVIPHHSPQNNGHVIQQRPVMSDQQSPSDPRVELREPPNNFENDRCFQRGREMGSLIPDMTMANIVLISKRVRNPTVVGNYRLISLINTDTKILEKILAERLMTMLPHLIHADQVDFMPCQQLYKNTRRAVDPALNAKEVKVFITYSKDVAEEVIRLAGFLFKNGFMTTVDIFEQSVLGMNIQVWMDDKLKDMSMKIIIAISPQYKLDIEKYGGAISNEHGLHTKYIHTIMQNQFIQQGSINYRFIPILFPNASEEDVPIWLRNTIVYRWPYDREKIVLRLMCQDPYVHGPIGPLPTLRMTPI
ncbi:E3 ubiquitin ligase TRAF3IP2 [Pelobates fuscus]|uniref:E3 ubiquitin ligase TRAF3IP2 n=1 Tax=Pelobates fuscus TaxID=191477 RepID=UPI002FE4EEF6